MLRAMIEQCSRIIMTKREKDTFSSQLKPNPKGETIFSYVPNTFKKVNNVVITLR